MNIPLSILIIIVCFATFGYVIRKIRKSQMQIQDSVFWTGFVLFLLLFSFFPGLVSFPAQLLGVNSPANFVFLCVIFILLIKLFSLSIRVSQLDNRIKELSQVIAIREITGNLYKSNDEG